MAVLQLFDLLDQREYHFLNITKILTLDEKLMTIVPDLLQQS